MSSTALLNEDALTELGMVPGSYWLVRINPDSRTDDAIIQITVIQPTGRIGLHTFTSAGTGVPWGVRALTRDMDVARFLGALDNRQFVPLSSSR